MPSESQRLRTAYIIHRRNPFRTFQATRSTPMDQGYPLTVIVRHSRENPKKCTILPLRGRPDLVIHGYPMKRPYKLDGYVRLAAEGPELSLADAGAGLLLLDGSWRWAGAME